MISRQSYFYLPLMIFLGIWVSVLVLYQLSPLELYPIQTETALIFFASVLMVVMGYLFYRFFFMGERLEFFHKEPRTNIGINYVNVFWVLIILDILIALAIIVFTLTISQEVGGVLNYLANPIKSRALINNLGAQKNWDIRFSLAAYGMNLLILSLMLGGILFTAKNRFFQFFSFASIGLGVIYGIVTFSRYSIVSSMLFWFFSALFLVLFMDKEGRKRNLRKLIFTLLIIVAGFLFLSYIIVNLRFFTGTEKEIQRLFFKQLNYYIIGNVVGFDQYLRHGLPLENGLSLFRNIVKWLARLGLVENVKVIESDYSFFKISTLLRINTYAYIRTLYEDFGIIGMMTLSFLWGFISAKLAHLFISKFTLMRLYFIVLISFSFFMSFFGFYLVGITKIFLNIVLIGLMQILFNKKLFQINLASSSSIHYSENLNLK